MHLKHQRPGALFIFLFLFATFVASSFAQDNPAKGSPEDVLAEIGSEKILRSAYDKELSGLVANSKPEVVARFATPDGRQEFLDQMVEVNVLQKKAEQLGLNKGAEYEKTFNEMVTMRLAAESMNKTVSAVEVKEEEVKESYEKNKAGFVDPAQYHLFQMSLKSADKAAEIKKQLDSGKSFVELAKVESTDAAKENGGDKGFVEESQIQPEIATALNALKADEVSGPIKIDEDLYLLVKYSEKKEGATKAFDTVSAQIRRDLLNQKQQEAYKAEIEKLKKEVAFEMDAAVAETLRKETLTDEEKNAILFKIAGKEIKVSELDAELQQIPPFIRPQILGGEGLNDFLERFYARHLASANAEKNLTALSAQFPDVVTDVSRRTMIHKLLSDKLDGIQIDDKAIEEFYQKNLAQFAVPAQMKAHHILVKEEAEAKDLLAALEKDATKFSDLAREKSTCPSGKEGGDLGEFGEGQMVPEFDQACKAAEIGKIVGPVKTQFGYHLIRVDERQPAGNRKLEDVKEQIRGHLLPQKQREAFEAYVEELKKEFSVKIHQENL
ncbi:MAG: peptidyl-prolyl cis-trans isomerase [Candidatus Riflebacteria bacterium]|nr:peptidyl-prolyl cis-trans isomerase [Candidatus Riflebacteria bacterium]